MGTDFGPTPPVYIPIHFIALIVRLFKATSPIPRTSFSTGSFEWEVTGKSTSIVLHTGDTILLKCAASSELCAGTLSIFGPDVSSSSKIYGTN